MNAEAPRPAAAEFFREEHGRLVGYVRRWLDDAAGEEAEDIVQDVALHVFNRGDITAPVRDLSAYVYQALKNRIVDFLRRKKAALSLDARRAGGEGATLADVLVDQAAAPQAGLERKEIHERLHRAIDALKPEDRAIILATDFEGWTFQELSEEWDVPLGTLLARKARALKKIKRHLEASDKNL
jgi:RNA polymerase sigma factor (sigma-70 family)